MKRLFVWLILLVSVYAGASAAEHGDGRFCTLEPMRILISIQGSLFDPTSGAARSVRTMGEMLAAAGHDVWATCGHKTDGLIPQSSTESLLRESGIVDLEHHALGLIWKHRGVAYCASQVLSFGVTNDILLTYGGMPEDLERMRIAKESGTKVVFALRNGRYQDKSFFRYCDGIITPSAFLRDFYRKIGIESTALPIPVNVEDCVATSNDERAAVLMMNPAHYKGESIMRALACAMPDTSFRVAVTRSQPMGEWPPNVTFIPPTPFPRDLYRGIACTVVPSLWDEPGGRVVAESLMNDIRPVVSDHGALPEMVFGGGCGGIVIPTKRKLFDHSPVSSAEIHPWVQAVRTCLDISSGDFGKQSGKLYSAESLQPAYVKYFEDILS